MKKEDQFITNKVLLTSTYKSLMNTKPNGYRIGGLYEIWSVQYLNMIYCFDVVINVNVSLRFGLLTSFIHSFIISRVTLM